MDENIISLIAKELNISISQVKNTLELLEEGLAKSHPLIQVEDDE